MKRIIICLFLIAGIIPAYAQKEFVVDANAEVRTLNASFNAIKVSGGIDLYLSQSEEEAVAVSAAETRFRDAIKAVVENGTLRIYFDGDRGWSTRNKKMRAYVSFKNIEKLQASGACDVRVSGEIAVSSLDMEMSGASDFTGKVKVSTLRLDLSGASDVRIEGTATVVNIESSGASDVKGYDLVTDICNAKASGASDINITVNKEINAHASGASDIYYRGEGKMNDVHSSGASSVGKKG